eukprot:jgi/Bigna1/72658/fgenesh1_pg.20_\
MVQGLGLSSLMDQFDHKSSSSTKKGRGSSSSGYPKALSGRRPSDITQTIKMDSIPPPLNTLTVCEHNFSLLTVARKKERGDYKKQQQQHQTQLERYLDEGGRIFVTVMAPSCSELSQRGQKRKALTAVPGSQTQCLEIARRNLVSLTRTIVIKFGGKRLLSRVIPPGYEAFLADHSAAVRCFSWHPMLARYAVAVPDNAAANAAQIGKTRDRIYIRDLNKGRWEDLVLKHQFQNNVNCMQWSPVGNKLAVGCDHGICLWTFVASNNQSAWMQFLPCTGARIKCVEFSPCGRYLATSAVGSFKFNVWDVAKGQHGATPFSCASEVVQLNWSSAANGCSLFVGTKENYFIVYKNRTWGSQTWTTCGKYTTACWNKNGQVLLLALHTRPVIEVIPFSPKVRTLKSPKGIEEFVFSYHIVSTLWNGVHRVKGTTWDKDMVFPKFQNLGYIRGPHKNENRANMPTQMRFRPHCKGGALLAVVWSEGQICLYPMVFDMRKV